MVGFIKLHRKIVEWEWYNDPNTFRVFVHLLLNANFEPKRWEGIEIERGQIVVGRKKLAEQLKLSEREIRTAITKLKTTNEIATQTTNRFTLVTINKYGDYHEIKKDDRPTERPATSPTSDQQTTTTKEVKERKEEKKYNIDAFNEFRVAYPGTKRGLQTELDDFLKKNADSVIPLLLPALQREIHHHKKLLDQRKLVPEWKHLKTWINNRCWEQEFPDTNPPSTNPKDNKRATISEFDFDSLNAQRLAVIQTHN